MKLVVGEGWQWAGETFAFPVAPTVDVVVQLFYDFVVLGVCRLSGKAQAVNASSVP